MASWITVLTPPRGAVIRVDPYHHEGITRDEEISDESVAVWRLADGQVAMIEWSIEDLPPQGARQIWTRVEALTDTEVGMENVASPTVFPPTSVRISYTWLSRRVTTTLKRGSCDGRVGRYRGGDLNCVLRISPTTPRLRVTSDS